MFRTGVLILFAGFLIAGCQGPAQDAEVSVARSPLETVNLRMRAYNEHDLDTILSTYSKNVQIYTYPDRSLGTGKSRLEGLFEEMFREGAVRVDIHHQITKDSYVINHETVISGGEETEYVSIYEVRDGLIRSVRFVRD
ncbi:MAG: nuclear transport factor 2 family protein [Deltaproteobacteria bacterium]|nr:nuclear transport factor 2 family protein [Deltaproteobacteria bacterium]